MGIEIIEVIVIACLGALAAILANSSVAVFNDGLRPVVGQYLDSQIDRKVLGATSFALGFGLVIGFGLPASIGASIILIHSIFLATDIIGTMIPEGKKGMIISGVAGAILGVGLLYGLEAVINAFTYMPYNFLDALGMLGNPIVVGFSAFPALAVAYQHGHKKGFITFAAQFLSLILVKRFGVIPVGDVAINLSAEGITLLVGMIFMLVYSTQEKHDGDSNQKLVSVFSEKVKRIKKYQWVIAVMGGLVAAATSLTLIAGDPVSQNLMADGQFGEAGLAAFARAIGFVPLVFSTAIVSGVYGPAGTTLTFAVGIFLTGNPLFAFICGFIVMLIEVNTINKAAVAMDKYPGVREMGENIRTSMNKILEVALLIGGAIACEAIAPGFGYFWIVSLWWLNQTTPKPLVNLAVGPVAAISLGIICNVIYVLGLWTPPGL